MPRFITAGLLVFLGLSVAADLHSRRIPNVISGPAMLLGMVLNAVELGTSGLVASVGGLALAVGILFAPFALGGIGGGDVKMMGAVGAFVGPRLAIISMIIGMIIGGVLMTIHLLRLGRLRDTFASLGAMLGVALSTRSVEPLRLRPDDEAAVALPYSVPLALGTVFAVVFGGGMG